MKQVSISTYSNRFQHILIYFNRCQIVSTYFNIFQYISNCFNTFQYTSYISQHLIPTCQADATQEKSEMSRLRRRWSRRRKSAAPDARVALAKALGSAELFGGHQPQGRCGTVFFSAGLREVFSGKHTKSYRKWPSQNLVDLPSYKMVIFYS